MPIDYRNDLVKHFVRTDGWLPICKARREAIANGRTDRRLKYFTFCAVTAIDVLLLDMEKILRRNSTTKKFDTVFFFDRDHHAVAQTRKRVPGAIGFPGEFVDIVLLDDPEDAVADASAALDAPEEELDEAAVHKRQSDLAIRREFINSFPFDVVNLDLEEFLFKETEQIPGRVVNAMRRVFRWQTRPILRTRGKSVPLEEFTLMFTTQIGPPNLRPTFYEMLEERLRVNMQANQELIAVLEARSGLREASILREQNFALFFKLAIPKVLAGILLDEDWFIDPDYGIRMYQFERPSRDGPYQMLHLMMNVKRQKPTRNNRAPSAGDGVAAAPAALEAYRQVAKHIFSAPEIVVVEANLDAAFLRKSLAEIDAHGERYASS